LRRALAIALALVPGCVVEVPLDGLECPCAAGWACVARPEGDRCERVTSGSCRQGIPPSAVAVVGFRADWRSPTQARFHWGTAQVSEGPRVSHYELWLAADAEALERQEGLLVYDGTTNPELARDFLPGGRSSNLVEDTTATGLDPLEPYAARLLLYDTTGALDCSDIVPVALPSPPGGNEIAIYEDALAPPAYTFCSDVSDDAALSFEGSAHILREQVCELMYVMGVEHEVSVCGAPIDPTRIVDTQCWVNVILGELDIPLGRLSEGEAQTAWLELAVRVTRSRSAFWAEIALLREPEPGNADPTNFFIPRLTILADDQWHVMEVPLRALELLAPQRPGEMNGDPFSPAAFPSGALYGFRFGAAFDSGAEVRIDSVRIRW
jgi:hypothetical protein